MAINETIVTGRKFRKLVDESAKLWQRISIWSKASDVEFDDGKTAETKFGAINGITDSLTSTSSNVAASAAAVKALNDKVTQLSSNIDGVSAIINSTVKPTGITTGNSNGQSVYTFTKKTKCLMLLIGWNDTLNGRAEFVSCTAPTKVFCSRYSCSTHVEVCLLMIDADVGTKLTYITWGGQTAGYMFEIS